MKNVLVFFGGASCEHDVSVLTGVMTANCLDGNGYNAIPVFIDDNGEWYSDEKLKNLAFYSREEKVAKVTLLPSDDRLYEIKKNKLKVKAKADCAINCLHGVNGEDGSLAGYLRLVGLPLVSSPTFAAAASMDKYYTKIVASGLKVPTLPYVKLKRDDYYRNKQFAYKLVEKIGLPLIVKPANLGSSIGITTVKSRAEFFDAVELAFAYDGKVVVEKALTEFREINCACYRAEDKYVVSQCEEPLNKSEILTFEDKYVSPTPKKFPADIPEEIAAKIRETTSFIYRKLEFSGVIRIDYLVSGDEVYLNEINSVPGSLAYYLFVEDTKEFGGLLEKLVEEAIREYRDYKKNVFAYHVDVLSGVGAKGSKS